jgi:hypothetical protein
MAGRIPVRGRRSRAVSRESAGPLGFGVCWPCESDRSPRRRVRFYFFSREEPRPHVHVQHGDGEAKFWLEPEIGLAQNHGLSSRHISKALSLVRKHEDEICAAWKIHFQG